MQVPVINMAGLNLAANIRAAETVKPSRSPNVLADGDSSHSEAFNRMLSDAESGNRVQRNASNERPTGSSEDGKTESTDKFRLKDKSDGKSPEVSRRSDSDESSERPDNVKSDDSGKKETEVLSKASGKPESGGNTEKTDAEPVAVTQVPTETTPVVAPIRTQFTGSLLLEMLAVLGPEVTEQSVQVNTGIPVANVDQQVTQELSQLLTAGSVNQPAQEIVDLPVTADPEPQIPVIRNSVDLPLPEVKVNPEQAPLPTMVEQPGENTSPEAPRVVITDTARTVITRPTQAEPLTDIARQVITEPTRVDLSEIATDTVQRQAPRTEWNGVLEVERLLNPRTESFRQPVTEVTRSTAPPPERMEWSPESSGRQVSADRFTFTDRINAPAHVREPLTSAGPGTRPEGQAVAQPLIAQTVSQANATAVADSVIRQANVTAGELQPGGSAEPVQAAQTVNQQVNAASVHNRIQFDPESLVSDVREVVMRIAQDGRGEVKMVLHPPELGELIVRLESARNGVVRAEFHTISPLVREALEAGITKLSDALKAEGLTLAQADVHLDFQLGTEGNSGETQSDSSSSGMLPDWSDDSLAPEEQVSSFSGTQYIPEGSTISILA